MQQKTQREIAVMFTLLWPTFFLCIWVLSTDMFSFSPINNLYFIYVTGANGLFASAGTIYLLFNRKK